MIRYLRAHVDPAFSWLRPHRAGSGEPNFDTFVANPFQTTKQRQTQEVVQLLDKLQPDTIVLDPDTVGRCGGVVPLWCSLWGLLSGGGSQGGLGRVGRGCGHRVG